MPINEEAEKGRPNLATSREPVSPVKKNAANKSVGEQALMDAVIIVIAAWLVVFFLAFTLRTHNI